MRQSDCLLKGTETVFSGRLGGQGAENRAREASVALIQSVLKASNRGSVIISMRFLTMGGYLKRFTPGISSASILLGPTPARRKGAMGRPERYVIAYYLAAKTVQLFYGDEESGIDFDK